MLARTRLRLTALGQLLDETLQYGPLCTDIGPIWTNCKNQIINIHDSPAGVLPDGDQPDDEFQTDYPCIAVYTDNDRMVLDGNNNSHFKTTVSLIIEIYACSDSEHGAEAIIDEIQRRVHYRIFANRAVQYDGMTFNPISNMMKSASVRNDRSRLSAMIIYMRQIEMTFEMDDCFDMDECTEDVICFNPVITPATCTETEGQ